MDFLDAISTDLPAPRDDEPAGLRQDILDELADHLACSYNRELLRGTKPDDARRRAIERFGNPATVARRLWLDAMKGKIMLQRVLIATCLIVVVTCFGIVGLVWSQSNRSAAQAAEANRRLAELLGQNQLTNQEMLRQLQAMAKPVEPARSADWIPVTFKLAVEKPDGPPAVGYSVSLGRGFGGSRKEGMMHRLADATGLADFGVVQPGDWEYMLRGGLWTATGSLNAVPGSPIAKSIVCPKDPPDVARVRIRVDWPAALANKDLCAMAQFHHKGITYQPPLEWSAPISVQVFSGPRGEQVPIEPDQEFDKTPEVEPGKAESGIPTLDSDRIYGRLLSNRSIEGTGPVEVVNGPYSLTRLALLRPAPRRTETSRGERYEVLALMNPGHQGLVLATGNNLITLNENVSVKPSWRDKLDHFEARAGQATEWVIPLPEEIIKAVEKKLKAAE